MAPRRYFRSTRRAQRSANTSQPFFQPATMEGEQSASNDSFFAPSPVAVQTKPLTVGQPGDQYEQEADRVADEVVSQTADHPTAQVQRAELKEEDKKLQRAEQKEEEKVQRAELKEEDKKLQRAEQKEEEKVQRAEQKEEDKKIQRVEQKEEEKVQRAELKEEDKKLQRAEKEEEEKEPPAIQASAPGSSGGMTVSPSVASRLNNSKGKGASMPTATQREMSNAFGADFSQVRIHTDGEAESLSEGLHAQAFTLGRDIYFNKGKFTPETKEGKHLLAHELTHVRQQQGAEDPEKKVQRNLFSDFRRGVTNLYHDVAEGVGLETKEEAEQGRLQAFLDHGLYGPDSMVPPTNIGGFEASYNPQTQALKINVRTGIDFLDGLSLDGANVITANHPDLNQAATDGNNLPAPQRNNFVRDFRWGLLRKFMFIINLRNRIKQAWSSRFSFFCTRPGWESVQATVEVDIDVHMGRQRAADHLQTTAYKVPDDGQYQVGAFVQSGGDQNAFNNTMTLSSFHANATAPANRNLLKREVLFGHDSSVLDGNAQSALRGFIVDFQDANLDLTNPITLEGHTTPSGSAAYNLQLAQRRIDAVKQFLTANGFTNVAQRVSTQNVGEAGSIEDPSFRRVDLIVGDGRGQIVAAHEFGHVIGLDDEYAINPGGGITGSGNPTGTVVGHDAMAREIGAPGAVAENNDDIMSLGNMVRPQHYSTFGWALKQLTGIDQWKVG